MSICNKKHLCWCGMSEQTPHEVGKNGCQRFMTTSPEPAGDDPVLGKMWRVDGHVITDYTLRQQRGYSQNDCGCWQRWAGSTNSLPDET